MATYLTIPISGRDENGNPNAFDFSRAVLMRNELASVTPEDVLARAVTGPGDWAIARMDNAQFRTVRESYTVVALGS